MCRWSAFHTVFLSEYLPDPAACSQIHQMPNHQCELLTKSSESRVILLSAVLSRSVRCRLRSQNAFDASAKNCTWVYMYHVNHASYTGLGLGGVAWGEETILLSRILYQVGYPSCSMSMSHFEEEMQLVEDMYPQSSNPRHRDENDPDSCCGVLSQRFKT